MLFLLLSPSINLNAFKLIKKSYKLYNIGILHVDLVMRYLLPPSSVLLCSSHIEELIRLSRRCKTIASFAPTALPSTRSCRSAPTGRTWTVTRRRRCMTATI